MACTYCGKISEQKRDFFIEKLNTVRNEAKKHAKETGITQEVYRNGTIYNFRDATAGDENTIEFLSKYN